MKRTAVFVLAMIMLAVCAVTVLAYEVDRDTGSSGGYSCYGTLWTIPSDPKSMGATTHIHSSAEVESNQTNIRVRAAGYTPQTYIDGPYQSHEVDVIGVMPGNIVSARGNHYATVESGVPWAGETYY